MPENLKQLIDTLIRDATKVGSISKSEMRRQIMEIYKKGCKSFKGAKVLKS